MRQVDAELQIVWSFRPGDHFIGAQIVFRLYLLVLRASTDEVALYIDLWSILRVRNGIVAVLEYDRRLIQNGRGNDVVIVENNVVFPCLGIVSGLWQRLVSYALIAVRRILKGIHARCRILIVELVSYAQGEFRVACWCRHVFIEDALR